MIKQLLLILFSSFIYCNIAQAQEATSEAADEAVSVMDEESMVKNDVVYGDKFAPNYIKFVTPYATRTIRFQEVAFYDEGENYSIHFPFFGMQPDAFPEVYEKSKNLLKIIPAEKVKELVSSISIVFSENGDYNFTRDDLRANIDCIINSNNTYDYWNGALDSNQSNMSHTLDKTNEKFIFDFTSSVQANEEYQIIIHVEEKPKPVVEKTLENRSQTASVYYYPELNLLTYKMGKYGSVKWVPLPQDGAKRSANFDPNGYSVYEFESLSHEAISFKSFRISRDSNGDKHETGLLPPVKTRTPDLSKMALNEANTEVTANKVYTIHGNPVMVNYVNLDQEDKYCVQLPQYEVEKIIGQEELPTSQELKIDYNKLKNFRLIGPRMKGLDVRVDNGIIVQEWSDLSDEFMEARYQIVADRAGSNRKQLFEFILYSQQNYNELGNKDINWWKKKAQELGVNNLNEDRPSKYYEAILGSYGINRSMSVYIVAKEYEKKYGPFLSSYGQLNNAIQNYDTIAMVNLVTEIENKTSFKVDGPKDFDHASKLLMLIGEEVPGYVLKVGEVGYFANRFKIELYPNRTGNLDSAIHYRPGTLGDLKISFAYDQDKVKMGFQNEKGEKEELEFQAMQGLIDYSYVLAALPAMQLKPGVKKEIYVNDYTGSRFGSNWSTQPIFNKMTIEAQDNEVITFMDKDVTILKVRLYIENKLDRATIYPDSFFINENFDNYIDVWLSKGEGTPIKMKAQSEYWLLPEDADLMKWQEWSDSQNRMN